MEKVTFTALDIVSHWDRLNDDLIALVDYIPEDKLDWRPKPELWNFRGVLIHTVMTRDIWMGQTLCDGEETPNVLETAQTVAGIKRELGRSWERVRRFVSDPTRVFAEYEGQRGTVSGHWAAFHLLEHDIHHRADIFHYLALLGIEHPHVGTP